MFYVGQKVVCRKDFFTNSQYIGELPKGGRTYTIRGFQFVADLIGLLLEEITSEPIDWAMVGYPADLGVSEPGWDHRGFRPLVERKTDISVFERALLGEPVHV